MNEQRDHYAILGVPPDASTEEIQHAYRRLARRYHPDINHDHDAERDFARITDAYRVLSDPEQRRRYDATRAGHQQQGTRRPRASTAAAGGPSPRSYWHEPWRSDIPSQTWIGDSFFGAPVFRTDIGLDDVPADSFARHAGTRARRPVPPRQELDLELSIEEAYSGTRRTLTVTGAHDQRSTDIEIPAGMIDGQRITLTARETGIADIGEVELIVRLAPHPRYRIRGRDIHAALPLTPWEAALGTSVTIDTPGGTATVTVPAGTSSGRRLRLRGRGLPDPHGDAGDFYAEIRIVVPGRLSQAERELFARLAATSHFQARPAGGTTSPPRSTCSGPPDSSVRDSGRR